MKEPLKTSFSFAATGAPLVIVHNFPGLDAEFTVPELRELIEALTHAADLVDVTEGFCQRLDDRLFIAQMRNLVMEGKNNAI